MKKALLSVAALLLSVGAASADTVLNTSVTVNFWSYDGAGASTLANATNPITSAPIDATFTYTGPLNWLVPGPQGAPNLVSTFLNLADISGFSSPDGKYATQALFGAQSLSSVGDSTTSFFQITGSGLFSGGSITHDDGASLYLDGSSTAIVSQAGETPAEVGTFTTTAGPHNFVLDYVEGNGAPSQLTFEVAAVPELSTWGMMLLGFCGLGFLAYRQKAGAIRFV